MRISIQEVLSVITIILPSSVLMDPFSSRRSKPATPISSLTPENPNLESRVSNLSNQLSSLNLGPASQGELNGLSSEVRRLKGLVKGLANDLKDLSGLGSVRQNESKEELTQLRRMLDELFLSNQQLSSQLLGITQQGYQNHPDIPDLPNVSFTGNTRQTKRFVYSMREKLHEQGPSFRSERSKINWIVRHFRPLNGNLGNSVPSYNWWMALLRENAYLQSISPDSASVEDPYILENLSTAKTCQLMPRPQPRQSAGAPRARERQGPSKCIRAN